MIEPATFGPKVGPGLSLQGFAGPKITTYILLLNIFRTLVKSAYQKLIFLFLIKNICCGYSKEPSQ